MKTRLERFMHFIPNRPPGKCWIYQGTKTGPGYGNFCWGTNSKKPGHKMLAHRASWTLFRGAIAKGMMILHSCDNKLCVNPRHLFLGTQIDNMRDAAKKGLIPGPPKKARCKKGLHPIYEDQNGRRYCKHCKKAADRRKWLNSHPNARTYKVGVKTH